MRVCIGALEEKASLFLWTFASCDISAKGGKSGRGAGAGVGFAGAGADTASGGFAVSSDTIEVFEVSSAGVAVSVCDNVCVSFSGSNAVVLGATRGLGAILGVGLGRLRADTNGNCAVWFGPVSFVLLLLAVIRPLVLGSTG